MDRSKSENSDQEKSPARQADAEHEENLNDNGVIQADWASGPPALMTPTHGQGHTYRHDHEPISNASNQIGPYSLGHIFPGADTWHSRTIQQVQQGQHQHQHQENNAAALAATAMLMSDAMFQARLARNMASVLMNRTQTQGQGHQIPSWLGSQMNFSSNQLSLSSSSSPPPLPSPLAVATAMPMTDNSRFARKRAAVDATDGRSFNKNSGLSEAGKKQKAVPPGLTLNQHTGQAGSQSLTEKTSDASTLSNVWRSPCMRRGMSRGHNAKTAFFTISDDTRHGEELQCSFPACRNDGTRFRFCIICQAPVAKCNFASRHNHEQEIAEKSSEQESS